MVIDAVCKVCAEVIIKPKETGQKIRCAQVVIKIIENVRQRFVKFGFKQTLDREKVADRWSEETARRELGGEDHCHVTWFTTRRLRQVDTPLRFLTKNRALVTQTVAL